MGADMGGGLDETLFGDFPNFERFRAYTSGILRFNRKTMELRPLREGSQVVAGTLLGRVGDERAGLAPHLNFSIRPAGRGAPTIDPKPILDGWKLLEATALYRVADKDPFATDASSISEILLLSKEQLARRVLADRDLEIYECGRQDIATGQIDRRLLAMLEYLVGRGYTLTITSLKCGHSTLTTSGNVSEHTIGSAVDIAAINGVPGDRPPGARDARRVADPRPAAAPGDDGPAPDHLADGLLRRRQHLRDEPTTTTTSTSATRRPTARPRTRAARRTRPSSPRCSSRTSGERLIGQLSEIDNPRVSAKPSEFATPARKDGKRASPAHEAE